jgi:hypothetical protein
MNNKDNKFRDESFVSSHIQSLHTKTQDFEDGDLLDRTTKFLHYEKKLIPISIIDLEEFSLDEELVEEYMEIFQEEGTCPEIVFDEVDKSMIDGLHRANALHRCGETYIEAYVGTEKLLNPFYRSNDFDDEDEDEDSFTY